MTFRAGLIWTAVWVGLFLGWTEIAQAATQPQVVGRVIHVQGQAELLRAGITQPLVSRQELFEGDLVRTGPGSRVAILLADESRVKLNAKSTLRLKAVGARPSRGIIPATVRVVKTLLELIVGEIWLQTSDPPPTLEIETPTVTASIRGTELNLAVGPDGESRLALLGGTVEYRNPFGSVVLKSGELGIARMGQPPQKRLLLNPEDAVQWSFYYPGIISFRDYPLVSADRTRLERLLASAKAEVAARPGDLEHQARLGEILHDLGRRQEARSTFEAVLMIDPSDKRALAGLGWVALEEGRVGEAVDRFTAAPAPTQSSLLGLSLARFRQGDFAAAAEYLKESTRRFGPAPPVLTQAALLNLLKGEVPRARELIEEALRLDPEFGLGYGLLSNIALTQNRKEEALSAAHRAVETNPHSPSTHLDLALAFQAHFQLEAALGAAQKAVTLDPGNARAHIQVARLLFGFDRIEEASDAAEKARSLEPNEPAVLTTLGFISLALRETQAAVVNFEKVLEVGPTSGEPYLGLGLALFRQGRTEEGLRFFQEAVLMEPRVSLFHSYLGKALYQLGRREDALRSLDRAHLLDPKDPTPELYKGVFQTDLNRPAVAIEALQRSVSLNDNRAIYRSRLLLDRDLAMRNVNLTRAYLDFGQQERAFATGILALHEDPQSSSAHLFYGSTIFSLFREAQSGLSELLQTRILQPVNQNTFNTFTDYTSVLEQPTIQGTAEVTGGNLDSQGGALFLTGGTTRLAGAHFLNYSRTDGPKSRNSDDRAWASDTFVKLATSPRSSLLLEFFHLDDRGGDIFLNRRGFTRNDPDLTRNNHTTFVGLGYQIQTRPENNLLLYAQGQSQHFRTRNPALNLLDSTLDQPFYSLQAAYLHRIANHQLWIAAEYYGGEPRERLRLPPIFSAASFTDRTQQRFVSINFQDVWQVRPDLYLTGALRYDYARDRIIGSELSQNSSLVSPQFGLLWRLSPDHTIRMAAFRAFQTPNARRLLPSNVAGFFNTTTVETSARSWQYNFAWDADLTPTTFFTLGAFHREIDFPGFKFQPFPVRVKETSTRRRTGGTAAINQILGRHWGVSLSYLRVHRDEPQGARGIGGVGEIKDGTDDLLRLGVGFVHPSGFRAGASVAYVQQDLGRDRASGAPRDFWLASAGASYEFPNKWGLLAVGVENLSAQRFDLATIPLGQSFITVNDLPAGRDFVDELPKRRVFVVFRVNF